MNVLGVGVSAVDMDRAVAEIARWVEARERHYVCVTGVHGVMESQRDPELLAIHNASGLTTPDGMSLVWMGRWAGVDGMDRGLRSGPDAGAVCAGRRAGLVLLLLRSGGSVHELLAERLATRFPGLRVAGTMSPSFRPLTPGEDARSSSESTRPHPTSSGSS